MIDTTIFSTGDITEVKTWLDNNTYDIFDTIEVEGTTINCSIGGVLALIITFGSKVYTKITLANGQYKEATSYSQAVFQKAYKTDNGILLHLSGNFHMDIVVTKAREVASFNNNGSYFFIANLDAPTFTTLAKPQAFEVTVLCPVPYSNVAVSEDILTPVWSQLGVPGYTPGIQIVQINDVNYVFNGIIALKE